MEYAGANFIFGVAMSVSCISFRATNPMRITSVVVVAVWNGAEKKSVENFSFLIH